MTKLNEMKQKELLNLKTKEKKKNRKFFNGPNTCLRMHWAASAKAKGRQNKDYINGTVC